METGELGVGYWRAEDAVVKNTWGGRRATQHQNGTSGLGSDGMAQYDTAATRMQTYAAAVRVIATVAVTIREYGATGSEHERDDQKPDCPTALHHLHYTTGPEGHRAETTSASELASDG